VVKIRVLLVDDDALVRAGLRMILSSPEEIEVVGEAPTGPTPSQPRRRIDPMSS